MNRCSVGLRPIPPGDAATPRGPPEAAFGNGAYTVTEGDPRLVEHAALMRQPR
ncbi:MAG: hypothetical protein KGS61_14480 [Verrucomicrobia bacterium]|nr:hypothetical protein [Verrucomicrobiota bacterium]